MKRYFQKSVSALAMSVLVAGGVTITAVSLSSVPAFSKSNNSSSGNGNGKSSSAGGKSRGATASSLGALNAAHANENAFENAAENSRVGLIALYKAAVIASSVAEQTVIDAQAAYDLFATTLSSIYLDEAAYEAAVLAGDPLLSAEEIAYWDGLKLLQDAIDLADAEVIIQAGLEDSALEAAANKETNEEVIAALWQLLGLPPEE